MIYNRDYDTDLDMGDADSDTGHSLLLMGLHNRRKARCRYIRISAGLDQLITHKRTNKEERERANHIT